MWGWTGVREHVPGDRNDFFKVGESGQIIHCQLQDFSMFLCFYDHLQDPSYCSQVRKITRFLWDLLNSLYIRASFI